MQTLFYFHDPMCSWCWGYRTTWLKLLELLPNSIQVEFLVGGLAPDSDDAMTQEMAKTIQSHWRRIERELGARFNHDFWVECEPRRSTYPACRAVIAAKCQNAEKEMILAIQHAYYLQAKNPSNVETLVSIAEDLNLDIKVFKKDINATQTEEVLSVQIGLARSWQVPGFPSLVLKRGDSIHPIKINYLDASLTYKQIMQYIPL
ncbi:MAG: putative protein-disulfide isomerase [Oleiphilaceae bacterium]|jgi:putative protein-disulfide isomerase